MDNRLIAAVVFATVMASAAFADASALLDGGWRISAGAVYNAPVKADMKVKSSAFSGGPSVSAFVPGQTAAEARRKAQGTTEGTRTTYPSGAVIDSADAHDVKGTTWNVSLPNGTLQGNNVILASEEYAEVVDLADGSESTAFSDDSAMPGVNIELSRNLYHNDEWHCGVDLCFGLMYFFRTDVFKADASYNTSAYRTGRYETSIAAPDDVNDAWSKNADGTYGAGTYEGPGPVFNLGSLQTRQIANPDVNGGSSIHARGDYDELELLLTLRPYYDVTDWFRIYGTVGAVVSRGEFDLDMTIGKGGSYERRSYEYADWDVYGIAGLGGMFRYQNFTLGLDFLARFFDDDIDVDNKYLRGSVERGDWLFKLAVGYEF